MWYINADGLKRESESVMKKTMKLALLMALILLVSMLTFTACNTNKDEQTTLQSEEQTTPEDTTPIHVWSEWITIKEAKCEEKGLLQRYCTECNYTESKPIDALGHNEVIDSAVPSTCTQTGLTEGSHCATCGKWFAEQVSIPEIGHNYSSAFAAPTATEDGGTKHTCSNCGDWYITEPVTPVAFTVIEDNRSQIGYTGIPDENLVIPAVFENDGTWYRVTSIGDYAFFDCTGLTSITIPNSVTSIGDCAFEDCTGLTSITVADGNTTYHAVGNCVIETASKTLILGCKNSVIPTDGSVTSIGNYAFYYCTSLTSITIPNSVTSIGKDAFYGCTGLTSISIPNSVTSIGRSAFFGCAGLTSISIPNSVTSIGDDAFRGCTGLTSITIPNSVTSIGYYTFDGCTGLTSISIPNSVTSIGSSTFQGCTGLTSISIPNSVTSIGSYAFRGCTGLTSIIFAGTVEQWNAIAFEDYWNSNVPATEVVCSNGVVALN